MEEEDQGKRDRRRSFERHIHTALLTIVVGTVGYIAKLGVDSTTQINAIRIKVDDTAAAVAVMYRASDAARDVAEITRRIDTNEKRIQMLDSRIDDVQKRVRYVEEHPTTPVHHR